MQADAARRSRHARAGRRRLPGLRPRPPQHRGRRRGRACAGAASRAVVGARGGLGRVPAPPHRGAYLAFFQPAHRGGGACAVARPRRQAAAGTDTSEARSRSAGHAGRAQRRCRARRDGAGMRRALARGHPAADRVVARRLAPASGPGPVDRLRAQQRVHAVAPVHTRGAQRRGRRVAHAAARRRDQRSADRVVPAAGGRAGVVRERANRLPGRRRDRERRRHAAPGPVTATPPACARIQT